MLGPEEIGIDQRRFALPLATDNPGGKTKERDSAADQNRQHILSALLPDQDAEHDAAHAQDGEEPTHDVDLSTARIRHVTHHLDAGEHDADDHYLKQEGDSPGEKGSNEPAQQRSDGGRNGGSCTDECIDPLLGCSLEVAMDE